MSNQFTFWNAFETKQHVTLWFDDDGNVWHLTRDEKKSVRPVWQIVGRIWDRAGRKCVRFDMDVPHLWVAATQLARNGASVRGAKVHLETQVRSMRTNKATDPDTLLGRKRRRSLDLGIRGKCDPPADFHERMAERMARK